MTEEKNNPSIIAYASLALVVGTAAFGAYQLVKLGKDWIVEGIEALEEKKNQSK